MATPEEIERRVEDADSARSARRSAAAKRVGELAQSRATIVEQLDDVERELGEVLVACGDVIDVDELARFTDLPATDLTRWRDNRKTSRAKKKTLAARAPGARNDTRSAQSAPTTPATGQAARPAGPVASPLAPVDAAGRAVAEVT